MLVHAAPALVALEVVDDEVQVAARGDLDRQGDYSPMTLVELGGGGLRRQGVWPDDTYNGL